MLTRLTLAVPPIASGTVTGGGGVFCGFQTKPGGGGGRAPLSVMVQVLGAGMSATGTEPPAGTWTVVAKAGEVHWIWTVNRAPGAAPPTTALSTRTMPVPPSGTRLLNTLTTTSSPLGTITVCGAGGVLAGFQA